MMHSDTTWLRHIAPQPSHVGYGTVPPHWIDAERTIFDHQLFCVSKGGPLEISIENKLFSIAPGKFLIIPPGKWHTRRNPADNQARRAWVHFDWIPLPGSGTWAGTTYAKTADFDKRLRPRPAWVPDTIFHGPVQNPDSFFQRHQCLNDRFNQGSPAQRLQSRSILLELLLELLTPNDIKPGTQNNGEDVFAIRNTLNEIALQPFSAAQSIKQTLAARGQSYDHQARLFKRNFGLTPLQYVTSLRITRARQLLTETDWPIQKVAENLGFRNLNYFDRLFKKHTGWTPGNFRQKDQ